MGSMFIALRPGRYAASNATRNSSPEAPRSVGTSIGSTPKSGPSKKRVAHRAATSPRTIRLGDPARGDRGQTSSGATRLRPGRPGQGRVVTTRGSGRTLGSEQRDELAPSGIVVNQTLADLLWPDGSAVGQMIAIDPHAWDNWAPVIGVVPDVRSGQCCTSPWRRAPRGTSPLWLAPRGRAMS
mgnify:CR=1 FL=1